MFKKIKFSPLIIASTVMFWPKAFATPLLSQEFLKACRAENLETVKNLVNQKQDQLDFDSPGFGFHSPLAAAASSGSRQVLSYLISHPNINVNKGMVRFLLCASISGSKPQNLPLFFGLLYDNDHANLKLLLESHKFEIKSLEKGLEMIGDGQLAPNWELKPETAEVLKNSKYHEYFKDILFEEDLDMSFFYSKIYCRFISYYDFDILLKMRDLEYL